MTTTQLAQKLARDLTTSDLATMPAGALLDIVGAINGGVAEVYALLPGVWRRRTVTLTLRAPVTMGLAFAQRYTREVDGTPLDASMQGCTIRIGDDGQDNEVTGASELGDEYIGTSLNPDAMLWHDAVLVRESSLRIASDVRLYGVNGEALGRLVESPYLRAMQGSREVGVPVHYGIEPNLSTTGGAFLLRVHPMPSADYRVRFEADGIPEPVRFETVATGGATLPIPERAAAAVLLPVCRRHLIGSAFWKGGDERPVIASADRALQLIPMLFPQEIGVGNFTMGTPCGF